MTNPSKIFLELFLLAVAIALLQKQDKSRNPIFIICFTVITLILNILFYYIAAWPLYLSYGQSQGLSNSMLHALIWFDIIKWTVLAFFLSKFAAAVNDPATGGGFLLLNRKKPVWIIPRLLY